MRCCREVKTGEDQMAANLNMKAALEFPWNGEVSPDDKGSEI